MTNRGAKTKTSALQKRRERKTPRLSRTDLAWLRDLRRMFAAMTVDTRMHCTAANARNATDTLTTALAELAEHRRFRKERR